jgi:hypothetical protein
MEKDIKMYCTLGWDLFPTTTRGKNDGVLPRKAELILRKEYYPKGIIGEFPTCPKTKKPLEILIH